MAIYVDPIFDMVGPGGYNRWCHMGTDDRSKLGIQKLIDFAVSIGLQPNWYQDKQYHKHFDLTPNKRKLAVKAGAIEVSQQQYAKLCSDHPLLKEENEEADIP